MNRIAFLLALAFLALPAPGVALPRRLVIALDGIAYRDMKALQRGVAQTNIWGSVLRRRAFTADEGYFPVSRMISTFPSTSDVAWTDIFGDRPLPGYQRTYYSIAANLEIVENPVATSMEHERQMDRDLESSFLRSMGYVYSVHVFEYELHELVKDFLATRSTNADYYAYIRSSDDAQHLDRDVFSLLCLLDKRLQELRAQYRAREGRDLQILIVSDHGHNHAGPGRRVRVGAFLERAGYRVADSIVHSNDVVLPTTGIETWVEIHNAPAETERLAQLLWHLKGVDLVTARDPVRPDRFIVINSRGERAVIEWNPAKNAYRYSTETGDPLNYRPVVEALRRENRLDARGFASARAWMAATLTNRYPLAPERIVRAFTRVTLNPATILLSLNNHYVHAGWLVKEGSKLVDYGSTHGNLDDLNSDGIVLSNFIRTRDTSSDRVAKLFDDFPGLRNFRAVESGAEWVTRKEEARTRIARDPVDRDWKRLPPDDVFLRVWSPRLERLGRRCPLEVVVKKVPRFLVPRDAHGTLRRTAVGGRHLTFDDPISFPAPCSYERIYACPPGLILKPHAAYRISVWVRDHGQRATIFEFVFHTNSHGRPAAY